MSEQFPVRLSIQERLRRMREGNRLVDTARQDEAFDPSSLSFLIRNNIPLISNALLSNAEQSFNLGKDFFSSGATGRVGGAENLGIGSSLFTGFGTGTLRDMRDRMRQERIDSLERRLTGKP